MHDFDFETKNFFEKNTFFFLLFLFFFFFFVIRRFAIINLLPLQFRNFRFVSKTNNFLVEYSFLRIDDRVQEELVREEGRKLEELPYFVRGLGHTRTERRSIRFFDDQTSSLGVEPVGSARFFSMFRRTN